MRNRTIKVLSWVCFGLLTVWSLCGCAAVKVSIQPLDLRKWDKSETKNNQTTIQEAFTSKATLNGPTYTLANERGPIYEDPMLGRLPLSESKYWKKGFTVDSWGAGGNAQFVIVREGCDYSLRKSDFNPDSVIYASSNAAMLAAEVALSASGISAKFGRFDEQGKLAEAGEQGSPGWQVLYDLKSEIKQREQEKKDFMKKIINSISGHLQQETLDPNTISQSADYLIALYEGKEEKKE